MDDPADVAPRGAAPLNESLAKEGPTMNPSQTNPRRPRTPALAPERLEGRDLMTGGVGSTFAIIPATISQAGGHATVSFNLDPKLFTDPGNKPFVLGVDVAANQGSKANPVIRSVTTPTGKVLGVTHSPFDSHVTRTGSGVANKMSSASLVTIPGLPPAGSKSFTYKVNVDALDKTSGTILLGFYLPGDATGGGVVNQASLNAIKYGLNTNANDTTGKYSFDADTNRDGAINQQDLNVAQKNFGIGTTVSPVISANLDPASVTDAKNRISTNSVVHVTGTSTPNASVTYSETGQVPVTAISDAKGNYSIMLKLTTGKNTFNVVATDSFNQKITGSINSITYTPDLPPVLATVPTTPAATTTTTTTTTQLPVVVVPLNSTAPPPPATPPPASTIAPAK